MTDTPEPIGDLLDSMGVTYMPEEGELIIGAVVLMKSVDENGAVGMRTCHSDGVDWMTRRALIEAARDAERIESRYSNDG